GHVRPKEGRAATRLIERERLPCEEIAAEVGRGADVAVLPRSRGIEPHVLADVGLGRAGRHGGTQIESARLSLDYDRAGRFFPTGVPRSGNQLTRLTELERSGSRHRNGVSDRTLYGAIARLDVVAIAILQVERKGIGPDIGATVQFDIISAILTR